MKRLDLSVGQRLAIGSIVITILVALLGAMIARSVARISDMRREKLQVIAPRAAAADDLETAIYQQAVAFRNYALTRAPADLEEFRRSVHLVTEQMSTISAMPTETESKRLFDEIVPVVAEHQRSFDAFLSHARAGMDRDVLREEEAQISVLRNRALEKVHRFALLQTRRSAAADRAINAAIDDLRRTVIWVTFLILAASVLSGIAVARSVREPAGSLAVAADSMREGEFGPAIALAGPEQPGDPTRKAFRDELREAAHIFGRMARALKIREERLSAQARLSAVLGASLEPREIAMQSLREVTAHVGAAIGAVYLADPESATLRPLAAAALNSELSPIPFGAGIPGQAAAERRTVIVREIPAETPFRVDLGFDAVPPRSVLACPLTVRGRVVGVILVASLNDLDGDAVGFVEQAAGQLAITLDNALGHVRIAALASELQVTNEKLQAQNEELQAQSEELQAQSEELQSQGEELQAQSEELQAQNEELQNHAEELRLQQQALTAANSDLVAAEAQKNTFLAVLGHELRNPLAAINGAARLLDGNAAGDRGAHEIIRRQTSHLVRLVDDLLDIARITCGKIELAPGPVDLCDVVERCVASRDTNGAPEAQVRVETEGPVWINADETRVEQIVSNLLTNAVKYTPPHGTIDMRAGRDSTGGFLRVSDTGIGIEPELLPRVFDFFVQGDARPDGSRGGLGVGLTLVKNLVTLHGGTVEATSDGRGRGTTVTVRFPLLAAAPEQIEVGERRGDNAPRRSIVLIEDNADVRHMMNVLLTRAGHEVAEAGDGPGGVELVMDRKPDLALVDLDLPGFDGYEVARRLRLDPQLTNVRLVAVSGYGRPEDRDRALAAGFDDHLVKPLDFDRLTTTILQKPENLRQLEEPEQIGPQTS